jgi:hypothetical protein
LSSNRQQHTVSFFSARQLTSTHQVQVMILATTGVESPDMCASGTVAIHTPGVGKLPNGKLYVDASEWDWGERRLLSNAISTFIARTFFPK